MSVLVVAAHPDDETLGAGGATARWVSEGRAVHWLVLGEGTTSRASATADTVEAQHAACAAAAEKLGVASITRRSLPDNRFDTVAVLDIVTAIEATVDATSPTLVVTHDSGDVNVDHQRVHAATLAATRPLPGGTVKGVWTMEVLSSTEWGFGSVPFVPRRFIDISDHLGAKIDALSEYRTEMRPAPHPRSPEAVMALATLRGSTVGVAAAEAFGVIWELT